MGQALLARFTKLGDPVLLLFGALAVFFYLWSADERRVLARSWAVAFVLCVLLTVVGKFVFHLVRWNDATPLRLLSPSGHVAIATGFYGGCTMMLAAGRRRAVRRLAWTAAALLLGLMAASRVLLGLHSVPEVAVALAIGGAALAVFAADLKRIELKRADLKRTGPVPLDAGHLVSLVLLVFVAFYAKRINGEALIIQAVQAFNP